jgi:hypothetical protein
MIRSITLGVAALLVTASLAFADPQLIVSYRDGVPHVQIEGDYAHSTYTISRATGAEGPFAPISQHDILCLGACFVEDRSALPDIDYFYRFDLALPDGSLVRYGPYRVTYSSAVLRPARARVFPSPASGPVTLELYLAGEAAQAGLVVEVALFDAQGRRVRDLYRGTLPRGLTSLPWDGRDASGRTLGAGLYFLRFSTPIGRCVTRVLRTR